MAAMNSEAALITELGQALGIPGLVLDEDAQCLLAFDSEFLISLRVDDEGWVFAGFLDEWEPNENVDIALAETVSLLSINLQLGASGRGTIGLDTDSDSLVLIKPILPPPKTATDLIESLEIVMDSMEWIRKRRDQSIVESGASSETLSIPASNDIIP